MLDLGSLTPAQKSAATIVDGPVVVFAGAGSGKTRVITYRIAHLIEKGTRPWEILAVTFTNKAAAEMRQRITNLSPHGARCHVSTFHSSCARWLREFASELGFTSDFSIYDDQDCLSLVKTTLKKMNIAVDKKHSAAEYRSAINHAKILGLLPADLAGSTGADHDFFPPYGAQVYRTYQETLALANAMDFGDLILNMLLLLRTNERVRHAMETRYRFVLVDEYQDTNKPQIELLNILTAQSKNLFVVGDDDQSIYSWRGAVPRNILEFEKNHAGAQRFILGENFRSTNTIVTAASAVIAHNKVRAVKDLATNNPVGDKILIHQDSDPEMEAWWIAQKINERKAEFPYHDVAIFYRTNGQSRPLEDALRRERIPYRIFGNVRFYDRAEVKDLLCYLKLVVNPNDDVSFKRVLNVPSRGLGDAALGRLEAHASHLSSSLMTAAKDFMAQKDPLSRKLQPFLSILEELQKHLQRKGLAGVVEDLLQLTDYLTYIAKKYPDQSDDKKDNIFELSAALSEYCESVETPTLGDWLQAINLFSEGEGDSAGVSLMTLHLAKGLEFPSVYVVGVEDGILPHFNSLSSPKDIEEERRLLYVGMTRAMRELTLSAVDHRYQYSEVIANPPSRFLSEIPKTHYLLTKAQGLADDSTSDDGPFYDDLAEEAGPLSAGLPVYHPTYGRGVIQEIQEDFGTTKALVDFTDFGFRKVSVRHLVGTKHC